jgi:MFS transporter, SP family, arabinose:H+ symporter
VALIINIIQLLASIGGMLVLAKFGSRATTLFGNFAIGIIDIAIAALFVFQSWSPSGYIIFGLLISFNIVFGATLGPVVWLYVPEIIPSKVVPWATMTNWLGASACVIFTPIIIKLNGNNPYPVFFFFGGMTMLFFILNSLLMVETKNRTKL